MRKLLGKLIEANDVFNMIKDGDSICVGVSGGKDSMCLLFALYLFKTKVKKELNWDIKIYGVHLKINLCAIDYEPIINFWKDLGIEFILASTHMGEILKEKIYKGKIQCSLCSKMKKAILIDYAKQLNCNLVAMGHHADDAIETLFMNMINEGRIATFKPKMYLDRSDITFIRPFILVREKDIIKAYKRNQIPVVPCGCPMEGFTQRDMMKETLDMVFYKDSKFKSAYKNFYIALTNSKQFNLWFREEDKIIDLFKNKK